MNIKSTKFNKDIIKKVQQVLKSERINYWTGNECKNFEKEFSNYIGSKYAISLCNGSVALDLALKALNLKKNDEIIVTPRSFIISASCALNLGVKPIFAEVNDVGNISIDGIKKAYNKNVKAIIIVHLNGQPCDLDPILKFTKKKKIYLIEDCSQAHGAIYKGKKVGSFGDISTWSFCQDKIISTGGEGGMILTNDKKIWSKIWSLKDHGKNYESVYSKKHKTGFKWLHDDLGSNYRMTEIQAAIGREQLKLLNQQIKKRNFVANLYINGLKKYFKKNKILKKLDLKCYSCPKKEDLKKCNNCLHAYYRLNLFINKNKINQIKLIQQLNNNKINCGVGSCPEIYKEKIFKRLKLSPKEGLPNAKLLGKTSITFPINPYKSLKKINLEIKSIKKILDKHL